MAGERKGITYEAIVQIALEELVRKGKLKGKVFWNEKPDAMTIEPDFTVGPDKDRPTHVFLVTHSGSAGDSHKKFWRNLGELAEAKIRLPKPARVYSIVFDSVIKEDLKALQSAAFDGQLVVGDEDYGRYLQWWVEANSPGLPKDRDEKADAIREAIKDKDRADNPKPLIDKLIRDLEELVGTTRTQLDALWAMERKRPAGKAPQARQTFVRRGLSKLLLFEDIDFALRLYRRKRVDSQEVPEYAYSLNLARKSIVGAVPADPEVLNAVTLLSDAQIRRVFAQAPTNDMADWLIALRNAPHLHFMGDYVLSHQRELGDPTRLRDQLVSLHADPGSLTRRMSFPVGWPPRTVWLLEFLIDLVKVARGSQNGFGYAQLAREVASTSGPASALPSETRDYLLSPWGHLSEWVHRVPGKSLPADVLKAVSLVLASHIRNMKGALPRYVANVPPVTVRGILDNKLVTYRGFEPLVTLICDAVAGSTFFRVDTAFAQAAALGGQAGKTRLLKAKTTVFDWQSVSDAGREHKKKELCGRATAIRYAWDAKRHRFIQRPGIDRLILVVDGTWRQADLDALARAGWDEIFYPDEMDKLVKAIV